LLVQPDWSEDHRGEYVQTYSEEEYQAAGIDVHFVQDDYSRSFRHVLRGLHGDEKTYKLVSCPLGKIYLVVLDYGVASPAFGQWTSFVLSQQNKRQVLIPPGFANGHLVLSDEAIFHYKQSTYYDPSSQFSIRYDDPRFNIWWPVRSPTLSRRDEGHG